MAQTKQVLVPVKIVVRYISKSGRFDPNSGAWTVEAVEGYLSTFYEQGYELFQTHYLGENPEGLGMVFVLKLKDA